MPNASLLVLSAGSLSRLDIFMYLIMSLWGISSGELRDILSVGVKLMDDADFIEKCELGLWNIIYKMHQASVRYEVIHSIMVEMIKTLEMQAHCEEWLHQYNRPSQS